mgnify:FL=1
MKCYVYYKDGDMNTFKPLNPNYEPTNVLTRAAVVDDSDYIRKELIDGTIEDNKGKAFVAMQLRSCDTGRVVYSRSTDESLNKKRPCSMSKKNEKGTTKIETYVGFDELLGYADAEYLLEDVVDVLSQYYTYEDETFDEDQAEDDPEFTIKIEGGDERADFYSEDIFYVHLPNKEAAEELAKD